ncbi:helix-turn-helix transcriptional regulator [Altererythrobacter aquaemixtae]|uniref:Helix-turn-helix transcriptional regulator n=2 Tax=Pontixanthobacter aquaemixtae TaxID=1958940 RepID=A0A844ZVM4_9SPHN|nr:helix-turn-helix transcriptional regulator [Pontixanthobacter aquaemixtae]
MEGSLTLHIVDPGSRGRAELSRIAFDLGYHAEVYANLAEIVDRPPVDGLIIARDVEEDGGIDRLMRMLANAGVWLPLVAVAQAPSPDRIVAAMKAGALHYLTLPLDVAAFDETLSKLGTEAANFSLARRRLIDARALLSTLSRRERQVLEWLTKGMSNKAIARELDISPRTVEIHRANMMHKMGADHAAEAVRLRLEAQVENCIEFGPWKL